MRPYGFLLAMIVALPATTVAEAQDGRGIDMMFDRLDADGNGEVGVAEITAAKERQFARADRDGDGLVTSAEATAQRDRVSRLAGMAVGAMEERFLTLDQDKDGALSQAEFTTVPPLLSLIDADGNGAISRAELDRARAAFPKNP